MYERQMILPEIGEEGQRSIRESRVTVIGAGGLGSPAALYLWYAGVGKLRIIDGDRVSLSNLNRQILYGKEDLGKAKSQSSVRHLSDLRKGEGQEAEGIECFFKEENGRELLADSQVVVDCVDNQKTRLAANKICISMGIPLVEGGVHGFYGYVMTVGKDSACLGCLGYRREEGRDDVPALGPAAGVIGSLQAMEALKLITGAGKPLYNRILSYDGLEGEFDIVPVFPDPECPFHQRKTDRIKKRNGEAL